MSEGNLGSKLLVNKVPFRCTYTCIYKQTRQQLKESKWTKKSKDKQWKPKTKWQRKQTKNVNKTTRLLSRFKIQDYFIDFLSCFQKLTK